MVAAQLGQCGVFELLLTELQHCGACALWLLAGLKRVI